MERKCRVCGETKPIEAYAKSYDGHRSDCRACHQAYYAANKHRYPIQKTKDFTPIRTTSLVPQPPAPTVTTQAGGLPIRASVSEYQKFIEDARGGPQPPAPTVTTQAIPQAVPKDFGSITSAAWFPIVLHASAVGLVAFLDPIVNSTNTTMFGTATPLILASGKMIEAELKTLIANGTI